jgi:hypothetical protein
VIVAVAVVKGATQIPTIPEALASAGKPPSIEELLAETDVIVRGVVGGGQTRLSRDQRKVVTDYRIDQGVVLYRRQQPDDVREEERDLIVTVPGGTVLIGDLSYTLRAETLPHLDEGSHCLLLLKRGSGTYELAGTFFGAFLIADAKLFPLATKQGFAQELHGTAASIAEHMILEKARGVVGLP